MLAQIGDVIFTSNSNIDALVEQFTFNYSKISRIGNNPTYQAVGGFEQEIHFSGYFVLESLTQLEELKNIAKQKKPTTFVTLIKDADLKVIITKLNIEKSLFIKKGAFIKQGFSISLKRWDK